MIVIVVVIVIVVGVVEAGEMVALGIVGVAEQGVAVDRVAGGIDEGDVMDQPVEGLGLADLRRQLGDGVVLLVDPPDLLGLLAELHRHPGVLGVEIGPFHDELFGLGHGPQGEVDLDRFLGPGAHHLHELLGVLAGGGEPLPDVDTLRLELLGHVLQPLVQIVVDHRFGRLHLDQRTDGGGDGLGEFLAGLVELDVAERLAQRLVPLLERVELAEMLADPLVVEFGELHLLHGGDLDDEVGLTLRALRGRRERQFVADRGTDELLVEVFGHPTLADLVRPVLGVQAEHFLAIASGREIERDVVAGGDGAVGVDERRVLALLGGVGLGEVVVGHLDGGQLDREIGVPVDRDDRPDLARRVELDGSRLLAVGDLDLRCGDQVDLVLTHCAGEILRHRVTQRLLAGGADAHARLEHLARHLAGAEARQVDLLREHLESTVDVVLELVLVDFDVQLDLVALEGFQRTLHRSASVSAGAPSEPGRRRGERTWRSARRPGRMAANGAMEAAPTRVATQEPALAQDGRPGPQHRRHPRCPRRYRGQGDPGQRLQLAALSDPVHERDGGR